MLSLAVAVPSGASLELHSAAQMGYLGRVEEFVAGGSEIDGRDDRGLTPLFWAVQRGHLHIAKFLVERGSDPTLLHYGKTYLHLAIDRRRGRIADFFLREVYLDEEVVNELDGIGRSALTIALERGLDSLVSLLLRRGADPDLGLIGSERALCYALSAGKLSLARKLTGAGAAPCRERRE